MPLYYYICQECGHRFDEFQRMQDRNHMLCSNCRSNRVERQLSFESLLMTKDLQYKDKSGETIWFPKDGKPYFDKALRRTFNNIVEKKAYMDKHNIVSHGSMDMPRNKLPAEAGPERTGNRVTVNL